MFRELDRMTSETHDLLIVGGGVLGLSLAREAASRGLRTALVEQNDFGSGASGNSQRVLHGGMRYLQSLDWARMRRSVKDRREWMLQFPHLVGPAEFVIPSTPGGKSARLVRLGLFAYDFLNPDQFAGTAPTLRPRGPALLSRHGALQASPCLEGLSFTEAVRFSDIMMLDSERLTLQLAKRAFHEGALLANHARAIEHTRTGSSTAEVRVRDEIAGRDMIVRAARVFLAGASFEIAPSKGAPAPNFKRAVALLLPAIDSACAIGVMDPGEGRNLFLTPWRGHTIVGVDETLLERPEERVPPRREDIQRFLDVIRGVLPSLQFGIDDVRRVFHGFLPSDANSPTRLADEDQVDEIEPGLVRLWGVKYTTAPSLARTVMSRFFSEPGRPSPARSDPGFPEADVEALDEIRRSSPASREVLSKEPFVDVAQFERAVREEMALTLGDLVVRRTELAMFGLPPSAVLHRAAEVAGGLLGWDEIRRAHEIRAVESLLGIPR